MMPKFTVYNTAKYIFHSLALFHARLGLCILNPFSKFAELFRTRLSYDDALKNIKQVYPWNENNFSALKGGNENIKPLLPNTIDVSFIVPCYNAEKYLERCAKSLVNQKTDISYEIIFVNDGSTDSTQRILESFKEKYGEKVKVIEQKNQGISAARNRGIENAQGKYLGFIDDDDFVSEDYLDSLYKKTRNSSADIVQLSYDSVSSDEKVISVENHKDEISISENQNQMMKYCYGFVWSGLIKKSLFENIRFPYGFWYEDMILVMALIRLCSDYEYLPETLYHHTIHKSSASKTLWNDKNAKSLDQLFLPLLIAKYSKQVLNLKDDAFLYKRILHEYSAMLYLRTKNLWGVRKSLFVVAAKILADYKQEINKSELSHFEKSAEKDFENRTFLKWKIDGLINRFETILLKDGK